MKTIMIAAIAMMLTAAVYAQAPSDIAAVKAILNKPPKKKPP
ncbi:hypothetical protein [Paraflavitalea speifideaquila]|nr:hypothetical protein [Paraflavitalea speifideiaquila]